MWSTHALPKLPPPPSFPWGCQKMMPHLPLGLSPLTHLDVLRLLFVFQVLLLHKCLENPIHKQRNISSSLGMSSQPLGWQVKAGITVLGVLMTSHVSLGALHQRLQKLFTHSPGVMCTDLASGPAPALQKETQWAADWQVKSASAFAFFFQNKDLLMSDFAMQCVWFHLVTSSYAVPTTFRARFSVLKILWFVLEGSSALRRLVFWDTSSAHEFCPEPFPQLGASFLAPGQSFPKPHPCSRLLLRVSIQYHDTPMNIFSAAQTPSRQTLL